MARPDLRAEAAAAAAALKVRLAPHLPAGGLDLAESAREAPEKYTWIPEAIAGANAALKAQGDDLVHSFNRYALLALIAGFSADAGRYRLPPSIAALYARELARIFRQAQSFEDGFFDLAEDRYLKDLAILTHRLIPVGAEYAEGGAGIPRRILFAGGAVQFFKALWLVAVRCRGWRPFFALHAHTLALEDFNPEGWQATHQRLAELLALNPGVKGWLSASWFLDPALEKVSPHLGYLRDVPVSGGAELLFVCRHPDGASGALSRSAERRRLFAEGKYVPATYMRVWPRRAAIAWGRRQSAGTETGKAETGAQ